MTGILPPLFPNDLLLRFMLAQSRPLFRPVCQACFMSTTSAENYIRNAKQQVAQRDINESLLRAITELTAEIKRLEDDVRRIKRDVQMGRRF
jgi:hypothetical protein